VRVTVSTLSNLGDTPALGIEEALGAACGDLGPTTACLFHLRALVRRQDTANHEGFSHTDYFEGMTDCVEEEHFF
jgi:hypothetical protein